MTMISEQAQTGDVSVLIAPHPFAVEKIQHQVPAGATIADIVQKFCDDYTSSNLRVFLNGHSIADENWLRIRPKQESILIIRCVPLGGGGGGKNPLRTVLSLAVMAASPAIAGGLTGLFGVNAGVLGAIGGRVITGGVSLLGRLALNALAPPGRSRFAGGIKESPTLFLQGARNQASPFGRVPCVLGKHRFVPPLAALPYTETVGNDQYIRMLFAWGYGPLRISEMKIGETPLESFDGVEIETRYGYTSDTPVTLFSNSVIQNNLDVSLKNTTGYVLRTTENDAEEISVDITFPRGLLRFNGANKQTATVEVELQYAPTGTSNWSVGAVNYTAFAAGHIDLPVVPEAYVQNGQSFVVQRNDLVVLEAASGRVSVISGGLFRSGIDVGAAEVPLLPPGGISLALVQRRSNAPGVVLAQDITDQRQDAIASGQLQSGSDFSVSPNVTANRLTIAAGGLKFRPLVIAAKQTSALRRSVTLRVPKGKYDVRLRRLTADAIDDNTFDEVSWTALRTIRSAAPVRMTGISLTALRIKATDQLNGVLF